MFYSTRIKLIASFLSVSFLVGFVSIVIGGQLLHKSVLVEARNRVRLDLNAAREIYQTHINFIQVSLNITSIGPGFLSSVREADQSNLVGRLTRMAHHAKLDFAGIVTADGRTFCRMGPNPIPRGFDEPDNPIVDLALKRSVPIAGTVILDHDFLYAQDPGLAARASIRLRPTPMAEAGTEQPETAGMALAAAIPIFDNGNVMAVLYGGILLNQSHEIVDTVRDTVFKNEVYKGRSIGTATVFLKDIRISTNVTTLSERRAIGTRVSEEVKKHVLEKGQRWTERAFVVNDWYVTAYDSIEDIHGDRVGMLYVGILEAKYIDDLKKIILVFVRMTALGMILAVCLGCIMANSIMKPVQRLIKASKEVSEGSLSPDIGPISKDEIGVLQANFDEMVAAIGRRRATSLGKLLHSEKQASIGRLAAGVAHEINNPLTGVLTFTHMLLRRDDLAQEARSDLETIAASTERVRQIVKGLLDFSRQTELNPESTDINQLVRLTLGPLENQALVKGIRMVFQPGNDLPAIILDPNQFQSVLMNIVINGLDATERGGKIIISTGKKASEKNREKKGIEIVVSDNGCGIPQEHLKQLFYPFFTTKEVGEGTGLGLAVSFGIIKRHGGNIQVESQVGKGSIFRIWLPVEKRTGQDEDSYC
jgi:two-component system NtrC family sensor kinase